MGSSAQRSPFPARSRFPIRRRHRVLTRPSRCHCRHAPCPSLRLRPPPPRPSNRGPGASCRTTTPFHRGIRIRSCRSTSICCRTRRCPPLLSRPHRILLAASRGRRLPRKLRPRRPRRTLRPRRRRKLRRPRRQTVRRPRPLLRTVRRPHPLRSVRDHDASQLANSAGELRFQAWVPDPLRRMPVPPGFFSPAPPGGRATEKLSVPRPAAGWGRAPGGRSRAC